MINIKTIVFGTTCFIAGYSLHLFTQEKSTYIANSTIEKNEPLSLLLAQCEHRNTDLATKISNANKLNGCTTSSEPATINREEERKNEDQNLKDQLAYLSKYHRENEVKKQQDFLRSINATPDNIHHALSENYNKDPIDHHWAAEKKILLDEYIAENTLLRSLPNVESDCRSKQCKIAILTDDPMALSNLADNIRSLTNTNDFSAYSFTTDEKNHSTSIYLDRK